MNETRYTVFVYGTLMQGNTNNYILQNQEFLGEGITLNRYKFISLGYFPAVVALPDEYPYGWRIRGELYEVDAKTLERLDQLEGNGRMYKRKQILVESEDGGQYVAWIYEYLRESKNRINHYNSANDNTDEFLKEGAVAYWRQDFSNAKLDLDDTPGYYFVWPGK